MLLTDQERALRDEVRRFVRDEVPADSSGPWTGMKSVPLRVHRKIDPAGPAGIEVSRKYGGRELPGPPKWWPKKRFGGPGHGPGMRLCHDSDRGRSP